MPFSTSVTVNFGGNSGPRKSIRKVPETGLTARLLPPLHSCSLPGPNAGRWAIMHKQHFGFDTVSASGDRSWNTFYCVEEFDFKTRTITKPCPSCEDNKQKKALFESSKKELGFAGKTGDEIKRLTEPLDNWLRKHNLDAKWYINVKTVEGEYCTLKIGTKLKKKLDTLIKELREPTRPGRQPIDVFDPADGIWLDFTRTGKGFDSDYDVRCSMETKMVNVDGVSTPVEVYRKAPLADDEKEAAEQTTYDLSDIGIRRLSYQQVVDLVRCDGNPDAIDGIFKAGTQAPMGGTYTGAPAGGVVVNPEVAVASGPSVAEKAPAAGFKDLTGVAASVPTTAQLDAKQEQQLTKAAALVETVVAAKPLSTEPGPRPASKPAPVAMTDFASMSIEELQKKFGAPKA